MNNAETAEKQMVSSLESTCCNLCGKNDYTIKFRAPGKVDDIDLSHYLASVDCYGNYGQIVQCKGCGLVYTNPRPQMDKIFQAYSQVVDREYGEEDSSRSINAIFCLDKIKKFKKSGRLLDIGCATGYFLNAARLNFEVSGVELSKCGRVRQQKFKAAR
jgi:transcription elongation factor Elf1